MKITPNRRIFLNIVATYGRSLYALVIGLFCGRWTLQALGELDYGLIGVVGSMISFVGFFQRLLSGGIGRFYALSIGEEKKDYKRGLENCRAWFTTAVVVNCTLPTLLLLIGYPIGEWAVRHYLTIPPDRISACVWVWRFTCINFIVGMVCFPFRMMYEAKQEIAELTLYSFTTTTLNVFFLYYAVHHEGKWLVWVAAWDSFLAVAPSLIIAYRSFLKYKECRVRRAYVFSLDRIKRLLWWNGWLTIGASAELSRRQGAAVLVNKAFGPATNAAWGIGATLSKQCSSLSGSLIGAFSPAILNAWGAGQYEQAKRMGYLVCKLSVFFVLMFAIPLALEVDEVLLLWLKKPPAQSAGIFIYILLVSVFEKMTDGLRIVINAQGNIAQYQIFVGGIGLLTALPLAAIMVNQGFSVYSVAFSVMVSWLMQSLMRVFLAKKLLGYSPLYWFAHVFVPMVIITLLTALLGYIPQLFLSASLTRVVLTSACTSISLIPLAWFIMFQADERSTVQLKIMQMLKKQRFIK